MEKIYATILSLIISCFVTYGLIVPPSPIFGLEESTNRLFDASDPPHSSATAVQTPNDNPEEVDTTIKSESQKVDDLKSEKGSSEKSGQNEKASLSDERISPSRSPAQTVEIFPVQT